MAFVLDCSVTLSWLLPDERGAATDALVDELERTTAVVPAIWPYRPASSPVYRVWAALPADAICTV